MTKNPYIFTNLHMGNVGFYAFVRKDTLHRTEIDIDSVQHAHLWFEAQILVSGRVDINIGDTVRSVDAGQVLLVQPGVYHRTSNCAQTADTKRYIYNFEMRPENKNKSDISIYNRMQSMLYGSESYVLDGNKAALIMASLADTVQEDVPWRENKQESLLQMVLYTLLEQLPDVGGAKDDEAYDAHLAHIVLGEYLQSPQIENETLDSLSRKVYLSKKQINRILQMRYNTTFKQIQIQARIENAKAYLTRSTFTVEKIAELTGYNNLTNFYSTFKKIVGCTPAEYRSRNEPNLPAER